MRTLRLSGERGDRKPCPSASVSFNIEHLVMKKEEAEEEEEEEEEDATIGFFFILSSLLLFVVLSVPASFGTPFSL